MANAMVSYGRSKGDLLVMIADVQMMVDVAAGATIEQNGAPRCILSAIQD